MEPQKDDVTVLVRVEQQGLDWPGLIKLVLALAATIAAWVFSCLNNMPLALIMSAVLCAIVCDLECSGTLTVLSKRKARLLGYVAAAQVVFLTLCYVFGW